jgi:hypothetical protein
LFNETFDAHDALEDVIALRRILFASPLRLSEEDIVSHCKPVSSSDALNDCQYLDKRHELMQTLKGKLYSDAGNDGAISTSMTEKIAGSGLNFFDLQRVFAEFGKKGLFARLSKPPTSHQQSTKPRVTKTPRILSSILTYFERQHHRVETYRDVTDRCKHCGRLPFHVPTFLQATGRKMINCACSASLK